MICHIHKLTALRQRLGGAIKANPGWSRERAGAGADLLLPGRARVCTQTRVLHWGTPGSVHRFPACGHGCACGCACSQEGRTGLCCCCSWGFVPSGCTIAGVLESMWPDVLYFGRGVQFSHINTSDVLSCNQSSATKSHCAWGRSQQQLAFPVWCIQNSTKMVMKSPKHIDLILRGSAFLRIGTETDPFYAHFVNGPQISGVRVMEDVDF